MILIKNTTLVVALLSVVAFTIGCKKEQTASQQIEKIKAETKEAAQSMKDYTYAQKAEFVEKMQTSLTDINRDLEQLSAKVEKSAATAKAEAKPKLDALREQTAKLTKQLDEAKNAPESAWDTVKSGVRKGYDELKDGFKQASDWVGSKIST
jgi:ABC-type transporter Mla subunit MlaD